MLCQQNIAAVAAAGDDDGDDADDEVVVVTTLQKECYYPPGPPPTQDLLNCLNLLERVIFSGANDECCARRGYMLWKNQLFWNNHRCCGAGDECGAEHVVKRF